MMKNSFYTTLGLTLVLIVSACVQGAEGKHARTGCDPLPEHRQKVARHGNHTWSDERIRVYTPLAVPVRIPAGWTAVGADRIDANCAFFPPKQAAVFVNPEFWTTERIRARTADLDLNLVYLTSTPPDELAAWKRMVADTYREVSGLFPLGLPSDNKRAHTILVTAGIAGDGTKRATRLFPAPGPKLTNLFYNLDSDRGRSLFTHTTAHLFNKRRPRPETQPEEIGLPRTEYRELVATWAELAFNPDDEFIEARVAFLRRQHVLLTDGDPETWPSVKSIEKVRLARGPFGLAPNMPKKSKAAREYAHYYLGPLVMLAIDGLLARQGSTQTVYTILREIHTGGSPGLLSSLRRYLPEHMLRIRSWMNGKRQIPENLISRGLARSRSSATYAAR